MFNTDRYVAGFLSVKEGFAPAHKLLGQILEGLNQTEKAITAFKRSLEIDDKQKDVILKSKLIPYVKFTCTNCFLCVFHIFNAKVGCFFFFAVCELYLQTDIDPERAKVRF